MAEYYIQDNTAELDKRIDDAFIELSILESRTGGLNNKYTELKQELLRLQEEQKKNFMWTRILTGTQVGLCILLLLLKLL